MKGRMKSNRSRLRPGQDRAALGRHGRRYQCFYQGHQARRAGTETNPYPVGTDDHACWRNGWLFADRED